MRKIEGYGEIHLSLGDRYEEEIYCVEDFDIELLGWSSEDGYNREPIFRLTPKRADQDEEVEPWEDDVINETAAED